MQGEASDEVVAEPIMRPGGGGRRTCRRNAQQPDAEEAPVLTLPITLPAGGGL